MEINKPNVVNLHFIDFCNYKCKYCFVKKENKMLSLEQIKLIVDNVSTYFVSNNLNGRINLVGGETFMCPYLQDVIDYIYSKDISVSIVTNGSLLTNKFIETNRNKISSIGISVDSLDDVTNKIIGRCSGNKTLSREELVNICRAIKENGINLKINHCISLINYKEDISSFIDEVKPDRFKVFQMTIVEGINDCCRNLSITNEEFISCSSKYNKYNAVVETEEDMKSSYLMIDSIGDFYTDKEERPIGNTIIDNFDYLVSKANLNIGAFNGRYDLISSK